MSEEKEWVTLAEARSLTGMDNGHINYYVNRNRIRRQKGHGQRSHRYHVGDLLAIKAEWTPRTKKQVEQHEPVTIDWIRYSDVPAGLKLAQSLYGEEVNLADAARYQAWRKKNEHISMGAFSEDRSECYAALMLVPLTENCIIEVLSGKRAESDLDTEDVLLYDQPGGYNLLATSALCVPDRPHLLYRVMEHLMDFFIDLYPERYVTKIFAQVVSETGDKLAQLLFMAPRYDLASNAYMLDLARPSLSKVIRKFQVRLDAKAPRPPELVK